MKYDVINARELTPDLISRWAEIQQSDIALASPYFRPEFTQAVAAVRDDVYVCVMEDDRGIAGFFPFHRKRGGVARPVGLGLSDYHGVIAGKSAEWSAEELLRDCGLVRWEFDHLLVSQEQFAASHAGVSASPIIDVSSGMDAFEASLDKSGRKQLKEARRKRKKLEAQVGPVTFNVYSGSREILRQLFRWKSRQCRQTGTVDYFSLDWCRRLIEHIHVIREKDFGGLLSTLHAGDTLAAVHFVMYSRAVWHSWFPAYNNDLLQFSPGAILLYEMIGAAAGGSARYIDLGKGVSLYKKRVMTGAIMVAEGCLEIPSFRNQMRHLSEQVEDWVSRSAFKSIFLIPGRMIKNRQRKKKYD